MPDSYTYPGTDVLINLPGYTERAVWKEAETAQIGVRTTALMENPLPGSFDLRHLQAIHAYLVQGFYSWGGQLRTTDTGPGGTGIAHCRPEFIVAEATRIFAALADQDWLRDRDSDAFSRGLAWTWGELTVVHPFRDVNTRSQFAFFNQLAAEAGWLIDWTRIDSHLFGYARTVAIFADERGIDALLHPALEPIVLDSRAKQQRMQESAWVFSSPGRPRSRADLDRELHEAIERRSAS